MKTHWFGIIFIVAAIAFGQTPILAQERTAEARHKTTRPKPSAPSETAVNAVPEPVATPIETPAARSSVSWTAANARTSSRDLPAPILVQFSAAPDKVLDALSEDLNVMTRLIQKDLERGFAQDGPTMKMGIPIVINSPSRSIRPMYIEGFGALFMIKVN